jgi:hypothetical protein
MLKKVSDLRSYKITLLVKQFGMLYLPLQYC